MCPSPQGRRLSPQQKYGAFVQVLTGEMTVAGCADHWGVSRLTIMRARDTARRDADPGSRAAGGRSTPALIGVGDGIWLMSQ